MYLMSAATQQKSKISATHVAYPAFADDPRTWADAVNWSPTKSAEAMSPSGALGATLRIESFAVLSMPALVAAAA